MYLEVESKAKYFISITNLITAVVNIYWIFGYCSPGMRELRNSDRPRGHALSSKVTGIRGYRGKFTTPAEPHAGPRWLSVTQSKHTVLGRNTTAVVYRYVHGYVYSCTIFST